MTVEIRTLRPEEDRRPFRSGDEELDVFFHRYAGQNQFRHHIGVTYVAVEEGRILGFATVSPGSLDAEVLKPRKRMPPYPLPILRLARLAVDEGARGRGLGRAIVRFAIELAEKMMEELGCVGLVVDATKGAIEFYDRLGFIVMEVVEGVSPLRPAPVPLFLPLGSVPTRPGATPKPGGK